MTPAFYYCYDAWCGWCYGFSPVIRELASAWQTRYPFEVLSGGMILPNTPRHISASAGYILSAYRQVEARTGIRFGADYLWHVEHPDLSDWYPDSLKPAVAMCIFREIFPDQQVAFAADLQDALHAQGRDLTDNEAYRHLLEKYGIEPGLFYQKMKEDVYEEQARYDFALCRQLQVTGFPTLLLRVEDTRFYLLSRGYSDLPTVQARTEKVLKEAGF